MVSTIDIIIPSIRFDINQINSIIDLKYPKDISVNITIIVDNPGIQSRNYFHNDRVTIIYNTINIGASKCRNLGIELTKGDWILFLDDDIYPDANLLFAYAEFIKSDCKNFSGAVGLTQFPSSINSFTRGVEYSQMLSCFYLAKEYSVLKWGVSSNLLLNRKCLADFLFSNIFPKRGGGEDIDLFIRIFKTSNKYYKSIPEAVVNHPWWLEGRRSYNRFFRWAYGDCILPSKYPEFRYFSFPNIIESIFLLTCISYFIGVNKFLILLCATILIHTLIDLILGYVRSKQVSIITIIEALLIGSINDLGRLVGNFSKGRIIVCERFDFLNDKQKIQKGKKILALKFHLLVFVCLIILIA